MTSIEAILSLTKIVNFILPNDGRYLADKCYTRANPVDNIYYLRQGCKVYVCYSKDEPHDASIDCLAVHFKVTGESKLQPFAAKAF